MVQPCFWGRGPPHTVHRARRSLSCLLPRAEEEGGVWGEISPPPFLCHWVEEAWSTFEKVQILWNTSPLPPSHKV